MNFFYLIIGIVLIITLYVEVTITTLSATGSGRFTGYITKGTWRFLFFLSGGNGRNKLLNYAIIFIIGAILMFWLSMLWVGNFLMIISDPNSIVNALNGKVANNLEKLYYTGHTLSTLGYGDFRATNHFWQIYSAIISFSGLIILSISVTYLLPILNADILKKKLSIQISILGESPEEIVVNGWNGKNFNRLISPFERISDMLLQLSRTLMAYPILHYFHSNDLKECLEVNLALLDEAVSILHERVDEKTIEDPIPIWEIRKSIDVFLEVIDKQFVHNKGHNPSPRSCDNLSSLIPFKESENINLEDRRRILLALIHDSGFKWEDIYRDKIQKR